MLHRHISGIVRTLMIITTAVLSLLFLPVIFLPVIDPGEYWMIALMGLLFPITLLLLTLITICWAFFRSRWAWVCLAVLLCGIQQILATLAFNFPGEFAERKLPENIRVMQWNVFGWDEGYHIKDLKTGYRDEMLEQVKKQNADILCFEEFFEPYENIPYAPNVEPIIKMGYPYYYFVPSFTWKRDFANGIAIFSKYPITDSVKIKLDTIDESEHIVICDVKIREKTVRVIATHLQSVRFNDEDYESISQIRHRQEVGLRDSKTIVGKLKGAYNLRTRQAKLVAKQVQTSPYPVILCADFNDVPNSNTYFTIRDGLQDTFLKKGFFIGRTFRLISPTLRIDYILASKSFEVDQQKIIRQPFSDHYSLVADLRLENTP